MVQETVRILTSSKRECLDGTIQNYNDNPLGQILKMKFESALRGSIYTLKDSLWMRISSRKLCFRAEIFIMCA